MIWFFLGGIALSLAIRAVWAIGAWIRFGFDTLRTRDYLDQHNAEVEEMSKRIRRNGGLWL